MASYSVVNLPRAHDLEGVLNTLIVYKVIRLKPAHWNFGITDAGGGGGHVPHQTLGGLDRIRGPVGEIEHRQRRERNGATT